MAEKFTNNYETTLNGAITNSQTTLVVTTATGAPTSGYFRLFIKADAGNTDEIVTVSAVSGTTFTIARATEAVAGVQSASAHGNGATVALVLTADSIAKGGSGGDWGRAQLFTVPALVNTEDDDFDASSLDAKWLAFTGADATVNQTTLIGWASATVVGVKLQAVPAGDWTIEGEFLGPTLTVAGFPYCGLILTNGTTQSSATEARWMIGQNNSLQSYRYVAEKFVNGAFSSSYSNWVGHSPTLLHVFLRIEKVGTTYNFNYSHTWGKTWQRFIQVTSLGFTPTHLGFYLDVGGAINYFRRI